jgi:hypothetical protein
MGAGVSGTFATGDASRAVGSARESDRGSATDAERRQVAARGEAVIAAMGPSVAPWVGARVGLPTDNEAGITYTGRALRLDARHAFEDDAFALSVGAGASVMLARRDQDAAAPATQFHVDMSSVGFDVPVLVGWRGTAGVVSFWTGARGGFERLRGDASVGPTEPPTSGNLELNRWYAGGVVGLGLGFRHLHGALELDTYYERVTGSLAGIDVAVSGVSLAPGAGIVATF